MPEPTPFLWLCGHSGVGKSTVGWELFRQASRPDFVCAYIDLDQIGSLRPAPVQDLDNHELKARNLANMWRNFRAAGADGLIVSGIIYSHQGIRSYADGVPDSTLTVCRLRVGPDRLRERIYRRGAGGGPPLLGDPLVGGLPERLDEVATDSIREAGEMERDGIGDVCIDTDDLAVNVVVRMILLRWLT